MIKYNPHDRITAEDALKHKWFAQKLTDDSDVALNDQALQNLT